MNCAPINLTRSIVRPPIAILGVPFDNVTKPEAVKLVEDMIDSRQPHYLVTPNVDFLVQARRDVELRRILCEAHLVLCDGTPLVWASRLLGNPLPERVAGSDLVPLLIQIAAQKKYRLFLLGAKPESAQRAVTRLKAQYPELIIAGHYSPPFNQLLEMDHEEIKRRIVQALPDLLFVSFGCPKQEKWVAMHYRNLGVPVTAGVGATIDFLAGEVKRAPLWMQRSGTEWIFRLVQEPRRLFRRYFTDLWVFASSILPQWWQLQVHSHRKESQSEMMSALIPSKKEKLSPVRPWHRARLPNWLDFAAFRDNPSLEKEFAECAEDCVVEMDSTEFIDSTGVGFLIRLQKKLRASGRKLVLLSPSDVVLRALALMRLKEFFLQAWDESAVPRLLQEVTDDPSTNGADEVGVATLPLRWRGEITAANAEKVWAYTHRFLNAPAPDNQKVIDLSEVRFIDSTGLGLMVRARKMARARENTVVFLGLQPPVRNVVRLSRLEDFLLGPVRQSAVPALSGHQ